ncbi:hypothetical protein Q3G72_000458 [Acer saccharum]|nr:hypothetical protein Q3G72_000458 [Acer saccharum]
MWGQATPPPHSSQGANLTPGLKGQFYLRAKNPLKLIIPGATIKYPKPWKDEWVVVRGDWDSSVHISGIEYPVPTDFTRKDKCDKGSPSKESMGVLEGIVARNYANLEYPNCDPFEGARVDRYLKISLAYPPTLPTTLPIALLVALHVPSPSPSPSPSITNTGILPRSSQATFSPLPSPVRQQQSPPPAVLPSPPTVRSLLSEMAMRATRILSSSGETQKQSTITPHARPNMAKQA